MTTMRSWTTPPLLLLLSVSVSLVILLPVATTARPHEKKPKVDEVTDHSLPHSRILYRTCLVQLSYIYGDAGVSWPAEVELVVIN